MNAVVTIEYEATFQANLDLNNLPPSFADFKDYTGIDPSPFGRPLKVVAYHITVIDR
jgi:hypothetical protein